MMSWLLVLTLVLQCCSDLCHGSLVGDKIYVGENAHDLFTVALSYQQYPCTLGTVVKLGNESCRRRPDL